MIVACNLKQFLAVDGGDCRGVGSLHLGELLREIAHVQLVTDLRYKWRRNLLCRQVVPVQSLETQGLIILHWFE